MLTTRTFSRAAAAAILASALVAIVGCKSQSEPAKTQADSAAMTTTKAAAFNTTCPISGEEVDAKYTTVYKGKTIGFCCPKCRAKWEQTMTEGQKDAALAKLMAN